MSDPRLILFILILQKEVESADGAGTSMKGLTSSAALFRTGQVRRRKARSFSRVAVQYIHHLKENEARNIEKWTLEKLLMDQAMGDLQAQLEEMRRLWEEERTARTRAESELDVLRGLKGSSASADNHATSASAGAAYRKRPRRPRLQWLLLQRHRQAMGKRRRVVREESGRPGKATNVRIDRSRRVDFFCCAVSRCRGRVSPPPDSIECCTFVLKSCAPPTFSLHFIHVALFYMITILLSSATFVIAGLQNLLVFLFFSSILLMRSALFFGSASVCPSICLFYNRRADN